MVAVRADADPFADPGAGGGGGGDDGIQIRAFLENTGIPFIDAKGHKFAFDGFQMIITHERRFLDLIERILSKLDEESSKQVEIEAKFLEVQEGALDEISFDWQYSWGNADPLYDAETICLNGLKGIFPEAMKRFCQAILEHWQVLTLPPAHPEILVISMPDNPDASMNLSNPLAQFSR